MTWYRRWARTAASLLLVLAAGSGCDKSSPDGETRESTASEAERTEEDRRAQSDSASDDASGVESDTEVSASAESADEQTGPLRGRVSPGDVTEAHPDWGERFDSLEVDESVAEQLTRVPPGAEVTVYFGPWCSDSRREVPRLWKSLEAAGGDVPFSVEYIALDRDFDAGDTSLDGVDLQFVPTFVVKRRGEEIGRIVESAPNELEADLLRLLNGDASGVVSGRSDL